MQLSIMKTKIIISLLLGLALMPKLQAQYNKEVWKGKIGKTLQESTPYPIDYVKKAPANAPNIIWILIDDVGFGATSPFGGLINTPTFEGLAQQGLKYTNFHTTGICSPTRTALLTGRNHHSAHMGTFPSPTTAADFPGYDGKIPREKATIAQYLRENGYSTFQVGKWHLTPDEESTDAGPFVRWPSGLGFDHNYGFLGGATDQYKPDLVEDNQHVIPNGEHLNKLITDKSIEFIKRSKKASPAKPFYLYYAPGAAHAPHQVATEWSDKYKGKFDEGWDVYREKVIANQKKLGVIPANAQLPARNAAVRPWKDVPAEEKRLFARFMEVYAGFLEYTDFEIGRLVNYLKESGQYDNTAIFVVIGDNGASKEGTEYGTTNNANTFGSLPFTREEYRKYILSEYDKIGTKDVATRANYPLGWAQACNTPFKHYKQDAQSEGGTHNPLIVSYPKGITQKGGIRKQYGHVIDLYPTTLDLIGFKSPESVEGYQQAALEGFTLFPSITDEQFVSKHTIQYYDIFGSRAIYKDGWKAGAVHKPDYWDFTRFSDDKATPVTHPDQEVWELYNLNEDFNERNNLAEKNPEKLKELKALFDSEATKYNVYPLVDWGYTNEKRSALIK